MTSKNEKMICDFLSYCRTHPHERFWQALRNWSGRGFIMAADDLSGPYRDTFYWSGKDD